MNKVIFAILLGLGFSLSVLAQTAPTTSATDSVPTLPKVWTGVAGDTSIGAISRKNPLHYLHVGETSQVKGWNKYDSPATLTILKQVGRHLDLEFKNPKYQINEVGTLSADGKQIQITSKEATGLLRRVRRRCHGRGPLHCRHRARGQRHRAGAGAPAAVARVRAPWVAAGR